MLEDENTSKKESYKKGVDIEKYIDKIRRITDDFPRLNVKSNQI